MIAKVLVAGLVAIVACSPKNSATVVGFVVRKGESVIRQHMQTIAKAFAAGMHTE